jgi:curved DNA-binding protein CbpA
LSGEPPSGADAELDALDYYTLLGVEPNASRDEVRSAFRRFALRYHPDRFVDESPERQGRALAIYRRGAEAVDVLTDAEQRQAYDAVRSQGETRLTNDAAQTLARATKGRAKPAPSVAAPPTPPAAPTAKAMPTFAKPGAGVNASRPRPARSSKPSRRGMAAAPKIEAAKPAAPNAYPVRTPQARAFLQRALDAKATGDLKTAWRMLKSAVEAEPDNPTLERELYAIERTFRP